MLRQQVLAHNMVVVRLAPPPFKLIEVRLLDILVTNHYDYYYCYYYYCRLSIENSIDKTSTESTESTADKSFIS